jgi:hypothetical protein
LTGRVHMVHTEVLQQNSHVDVVEERLETGYVCGTENKTMNTVINKLVTCFRSHLMTKSVGKQLIVETIRSVVLSITYQLSMS